MPTPGRFDAQMRGGGNGPCAAVRTSQYQTQMAALGGRLGGRRREVTFSLQAIGGEFRFADTCVAVERGRCIGFQ